MNPDFGERVAGVLSEHGLSLRAARIRTGIDHVTLSDMATGYVPRLERVEQFARAFGLDVNEWRELAGYPRMDEPSGPYIFWAGLNELHQEFGRPIAIEFNGSAQSLTPERARQELEQLRKLLEAGKI